MPGCQPKRQPCPGGRQADAWARRGSLGLARLCDRQNDRRCATCQVHEDHNPGDGSEQPRGTRHPRFGLLIGMVFFVHSGQLSCGRWEIKAP